MLAIDKDVRPSMGAVAESLARLAKGRFDEEAPTLAASDEGPKDEETTPAAYSGHDAQQATGPSPAAAPKSPVASAPASQAQRPTEPRRRRGLAAAVTVVALIGIGILVTALLVNDRRAANPTVDAGPSISAVPASLKSSSAAIPDSKRTFTDSQSVRTTAGSSTEPDATKQTSYAIAGLHRQRPRQRSAARPPRRSSGGRSPAITR